MPKNIEQPVDLKIPSSEIFEFCFTPTAKLGSKKFVFISPKTEGKTLWETAVEKAENEGALPQDPAVFRDRCFYSLAESLSQQSPSLDERVIIEIKEVRRKPSQRPKEQETPLVSSFQPTQNLAAQIEENLDLELFTSSSDDELDINYEAHLNAQLDGYKNRDSSLIQDEILKLKFLDPYVNLESTFLARFLRSDYQEDQKTLDLELIKNEIESCDYFLNFLTFLFPNKLNVSAEPSDVLKNLSEKKERLELILKENEVCLKDVQSNPDREKQVAELLKKYQATYQELNKYPYSNESQINNLKLDILTQLRSSERFLKFAITTCKSLLETLERFNTPVKISIRISELSNLKNSIEYTRSRRHDHIKDSRRSLNCIVKLNQLNFQEFSQFLLKEIATKIEKALTTSSFQEKSSLSPEEALKNKKAQEDELCLMVYRQVLESVFNHLNSKVSAFTLELPSYLLNVDNFLKQTDDLTLVILKDQILKLCQRGVSYARRLKAFKELENIKDIEQTNDTSEYVYEYAIIESSQEGIAKSERLEFVGKKDVSNLAYVVQECSQPLLQIPPASTFTLIAETLAYLVKSLLEAIKSALIAIYELASGCSITPSITIEDLYLPSADNHHLRAPDYRTFLAHLDVASGLFNHLNESYPGEKGSKVPLDQQKNPESQLVFQSYASQTAYLLQEGKEIGELLLQAQDSGADKKALEKLNQQLHAKFKKLVNGDQEALLIPVADGEGPQFTPQFLIFLLDPRSTSHKKTFLLKHVHIAPSQNNKNTLPSVTTYDVTDLLTTYVSPPVISEEEASKEEKTQMPLLEGLIRAIVTLLPQKGRQKTDLKVSNQFSTFIQSYLTSFTGLKALSTTEPLQEEGSNDPLETLFLMLQQVPSKHVLTEKSVYKQGKVVEVLENTTAGEINQADPLFSLTHFKGAFYHAYAGQLVRIFENQKRQFSEAQQLQILKALEWYITKAEAQLQQELGIEGAAIVTQSIREYTHKKIECFEKTQEAEKKDVARLNQPAELLSSNIEASFSSSIPSHDLKEKNVKVETLPAHIQDELHDIENLIKGVATYSTILTKFQKTLSHVQSLIKGEKKEAARLLALELIRLLPVPSAKENFWSYFDEIIDENHAKECKQWQQLLSSLTEMTWKSISLSGAFPLPTHEALEFEIVLPLIQRHLYYSLIPYYAKIENEMLSKSYLHQEELLNATKAFLAIREEELKEKTLSALQNVWEKEDKKEYQKVDQYPQKLLAYEQELVEYEKKLKHYEEFKEFEKKLLKALKELKKTIDHIPSFRTEKEYTQFKNTIQSQCQSKNQSCPAFPSYVSFEVEPKKPQKPEPPPFIDKAYIQELQKKRLDKEFVDQLEKVKKEDSFYSHLSTIINSNNPLYLNLNTNRKTILTIEEKEASTLKGLASGEKIEKEHPTLWIYALWGRYLQILGISKEIWGYGFLKELSTDQNRSGKRLITFDAFFLKKDASLLIGGRPDLQERWNSCKSYYETNISIIPYLPLKVTDKHCDKLAHLVLGYQKTNCYQKPKDISEFPARNFLIKGGEKIFLRKDLTPSIIALVNKAHRGALPEEDALFYGVPPQTVALCKTEAMIEMVQRPHEANLKYAPGIFKRTINQGIDVLPEQGRKFLKSLTETSPLRFQELDSLRRRLNQEKDLYLIPGPGDYYYLLPDKESSYLNSTYCISIPTNDLESTKTYQRKNHLGVSPFIENTVAKGAPPIPILDPLVTTGEIHRNFDHPDYENKNFERIENHVLKELKPKNKKTNVTESSEDEFKDFLLNTLNLSQVVYKGPHPYYERSSITIPHCLHAFYQLPQHLEEPEFWHSIYNALFQRDLALTLMRENPELFIYLGEILTTIIPYIKHLSFNEEHEKFEAILFIHEIAGRFRLYLDHLRGELDKDLYEAIFNALPPYNAQVMVSPFNNHAATSQQKVTAFYALLYITKNANYLLDNQNSQGFNPDRLDIFLKAYAVYLQSSAIFQAHPGLHHELLSTIRLNFLPAIDKWLEKNLQSHPTETADFLKTLTGKPDSSSSTAEWRKQTDYVYCLGDNFILDLSNGTGIHIERKSLFSRTLLPSSILESKEYRLLFGDKVHISNNNYDSIQGSVIYSFEDDAGTPFEIIQNNTNHSLQFLQIWEGKRYLFQHFSLDLSWWQELFPKGERSHAFFNFLAANGSWVRTGKKGEPETTHVLIPQVGYRLEDAYGAVINKNRLQEAFIGSGTNKKWICSGLKNDIEPLLPCCNIQDLILLSYDKKHIDEIRFPNGLILQRSAQDPQSWKVFGREDWEWHLTDTSQLETQFGKQYREFLLPLINRKTQEQEVVLFPHLFESRPSGGLQFYGKPSHFYKKAILDSFTSFRNLLNEDISAQQQLSSELKQQNEIFDLVLAYQPALGFLLEYFKERKSLLSKTQETEGTGTKKTSLIENLDSAFEEFEKSLTQKTFSHFTEGVVSNLFNPLFFEDALSTTLVLSQKHEQGSYMGYLYLAFMAYAQGQFGTASHFLQRMTTHGKLYLDFDMEQMTRKATREEVRLHKKEIEKRALDHFVRTIEFVFSFSSFAGDGVLKTLPSAFVFSSITNAPKPEQLAFHLKLTVALVKIHAVLKVRLELPPTHSLHYETKPGLLALYDALPASEKALLKSKGLYLTQEEHQFLSAANAAPADSYSMISPPIQELFFKVPSAEETKTFIENFSLYNISAKPIAKIHRQFGAVPKLETVVAHFWDYWQWIIETDLSPYEIAFLMQPPQGLQIPVVDVARRLLLSLYYMNKRVLTASKNPTDFFVTMHNLFRDIQRYRTGIDNYGEQLARDQKFAQEFQKPNSFFNKALSLGLHYGRKLFNTGSHYFLAEPDPRKKGGVAYVASPIHHMNQQMHQLLVEHLVLKLNPDADPDLALTINLTPVEKQKPAVGATQPVAQAAQPAVTQSVKNTKKLLSTLIEENLKTSAQQFILNKIDSLPKGSGFIFNMVYSGVIKEVDSQIPSLLDNILIFVKNPANGFKDFEEAKNYCITTLYKTLHSALINNEYAKTIESYFPQLIPNIQPWTEEFFETYYDDLKAIYDEARQPVAIDNNNANPIVDPSLNSNVNPHVDLSRQPAKPVKATKPFSIYDASISLEEAQKSALEKDAWKNYFRSEKEKNGGSPSQNVWKVHQTGWEKALSADLLQQAPLSLGERFRRTFAEPLPQEQEKLSKQTDTSLKVTYLKNLKTTLTTRKKALQEEIQTRQEALIAFCYRNAQYLEIQSLFTDHHFPPKSIVNEVFYRLSRGQIRNLDENLGKELSEKAVAYMLVATEVQQIEKALHTLDTMWKQLERLFKTIPPKYKHSSSEVLGTVVQELADSDKDWLDRSLDLSRHLYEGANRLRYAVPNTLVLADPSMSLKYLYEDYSKHQITRLEAKEALERLLGVYAKDLSEEELLKLLDKKVDSLIKGEQFVKLCMGLGKSTFVFPMISRRMWEKNVIPVMMTTPELLPQLESFMGEKCFEFYFDINFGIRHDPLADETTLTVEEEAAKKNLIFSHLQHLARVLPHLAQNHVTILTTSASLGSLRDKRVEMQDKLSRASKGSPEEEEAFMLLTLLQNIQSFFRQKNLIFFQDEENSSEISNEYNFASGERRSANLICVNVAYEFVSEILRDAQLNEALLNDKLRALDNPEKTLEKIVRSILNNEQLWINQFRWKKESWAALNKDELFSYLTGKDTTPPACLAPLREFSQEQTADQIVANALLLQTLKDKNLFNLLQKYLQLARNNQPINNYGSLKFFIEKLDLKEEVKKDITPEGVFSCLYQATSFEHLLKKKPSLSQLVEKHYPHLCYLQALKMVFDTFKTCIYKTHPKLERGINQTNGCSVVPYSDGHEKPMTIYGNEIEFILHHYLHYIGGISGHASNKAFEAFFIRKIKELTQRKMNHQILGSERLWSDWFQDIADFKRQYPDSSKISSFEALTNSHPRMIQCRLEFIRYLLEEQHDLKLYAEQIECNSQDVTSNIFKQVQVASGTGDSFAMNLLSPDGKKKEEIGEKDGITAKTLLCLNPDEKIGLDHIFDDPLDYIKKIAREENCHAIMNKGFEVLSNQTEHLAALLREEGEREQTSGHPHSILAKRQFLFSHSVSGQKKIWHPGMTTPVAYATDLVDPSKALALFSPAQCRGLDFLLPRDKEVFGVLMVDLNTTVEDFNQALGRMRQLGRGQKGKLAIDKKMAARVCFLNNITDISKITVADVFRTILKRTELEERMRHKKAVCFDIKTIRRNELDNLLCAPSNSLDRSLKFEKDKEWSKRLFTILRTLYYRNNEIAWNDQTKKLSRLKFLETLYDNEIQEVKKTRQDLCAIWLDYALLYEEQSPGFHDPHMTPVLQALDNIENTLKSRKEALQDENVQAFYEYYLEQDTFEISSVDTSSNQEQMVQQQIEQQVQQYVEQFTFTSFQHVEHLDTIPPLDFDRFFRVAIKGGYLSMNQKGGTYISYYPEPLGNFKPLMLQSDPKDSVPSHFTTLPMIPFFYPFFKNQYISRRAEQELQNTDKGKQLLYMLVVQTEKETTTCLIAISEWGAIKKHIDQYLDPKISVALMALPSWHLHRAAKERPDLKKKESDLLFVTYCPQANNTYAKFDRERPDLLDRVLGNKIFMDLAFFTEREERVLKDYYERYSGAYPEDDEWSKCNLPGLKGWFKKFLGASHGETGKKSQSNDPNQNH